jgi:hypothetical protein
MTTTQDPPATTTQAIDLSALMNNVGATPAPAKDAGQFNVWRNSFASEEMPDQDTLVLSGVEFRTAHLRDAGADNVRCDGQLLAIPPGCYDWVHLLAASERRVEDEMCLHFTDGTADFEHVRVSDFWAAPAVFGERPAMRSQAMHYPQHVQFGVPATMWWQRVPVTRRATLQSVRLPRNPALHIFAVTLQFGPREVTA